MFEFLLSGILRLLTGLFQAVFSAFGGFLDLSLEEIVRRFPFLYDGYQIFCTIGIGLAVAFAIIQVFRFFTGSQNVTESPVATLVRTAITIPLIKFSGVLITEIVDFAKIPYDAMRNVDIAGSELSASWSAITPGLSSVLLVGAGDALALTALVKLGISVCLVAAIGWNILKLIIEICERYLLVGVLAYTSPLCVSAMSTGGTSNICSKWVSMFVGQLAIMTMSVWSYNVVLSGLKSIGSGGSEFFFVDLVMILAMCKIGMRIDTYMQQIGVGVGTTGGGLFDEAVGMFHTLSRFARGKKQGGGSGAGETGRSQSVLGGSMDEKGNVRPDPVGAGLIGAARTATRYGKASLKNGGNMNDVMKAASKGAVDGFGIKIDPKAGHIEDMSFATGRKFNEFVQARREQKSPYAGHNYGSALKSGDGNTTHLNQTAQQQGLRLGKNGTLNGPANVAGGFAATNFSDIDAHELLRETFKNGNPEIAEAMFSRGDDFTYDATSGLAKNEFDQLGSDALTSMLKNGVSELEMKDNRSDVEDNALDMAHMMQASMVGESGNVHLQNFSAGYIDGEAKSGWVAQGQVVDGAGQPAGSMTLLDQTAYDALPEGEKNTYAAISSASGKQFYMNAYMRKATQSDAPNATRTATTPLTTRESAVTSQAQGVVASMGGNGSVVSHATKANEPTPQRQQAVYQYFPKEMGEDNPKVSAYGAEQGVSFVSDGQGNFSIEGDDESNVASAIVEGLNSPRMKSNQIAENTISKPDANPDVMQAALYDKNVAPIQLGNDKAVASMVNKVFGQDVLEGEIQKATGHEQLSGDALRNFAPAVARVANEGDAIMKQDNGYSVDEFATTGDGAVKCTYHTPDGDYHIESRQIISSDFSESRYDWSVARENGVENVQFMNDADDTESISEITPAIGEQQPVTPDRAPSTAVPYSYQKDNSSEPIIASGKRELEHGESQESVFGTAGYVSAPSIAESPLRAVPQNNEPVPVASGETVIPEVVAVAQPTVQTPAPVISQIDPIIAPAPEISAKTPIQSAEVLTQQSVSMPEIITYSVEKTEEQHTVIEHGSDVSRATHNNYSTPLEFERDTWYDEDDMPAYEKRRKQRGGKLKNKPRKGKNGRRNNDEW